jgi:hypothetical protein
LLNDEPTSPLSLSQTRDKRPANEKEEDVNKSQQMLWAFYLAPDYFGE